MAKPSPLLHAPIRRKSSSKSIDAKTCFGDQAIFDGMLVGARRTRGSDKLSVWLSEAFTPGTPDTALGQPNRGERHQDDGD
jgi:hypothetical protein